MLLRYQILSLGFLCAVLVIAFMFYFAPKPLEFDAPPKMRVFVSAMTGERTATAVAHIKLKQDDVLTEITGPAKTIRAVRLPDQAPTTEADFGSLLPLTTADLRRRPLLLRLTELARDFPSDGQVTLTLRFKHLGRRSVAFDIQTEAEVRQAFERKAEKQ